MYFGEFIDPFDVVIYGKKGEHQEFTDLEAKGQYHKYCEPKADPTDKYTCKSTDVTRSCRFRPYDSQIIQTNITDRFKDINDFYQQCGKVPGCFIATNRNWTCLNSSLLYPQQDIMLIDGSDFFDIAADR